MEKKIFLIALVSVSFLLFGCSVNYTSETRGFTYKHSGGEFNCSQTPLQAVLKIEKGALDELANVQNIEIKVNGGDKFPEPKDLVNYCTRFLNGEISS